MAIDAPTHSLFGVSRASADLAVQEYGRYLQMPARPASVPAAGPSRGHAGAELHGFLSYLLRCTAEGRPYTVFGYGGKQVRDNMHS